MSTNKLDSLQKSPNKLHFLFYQEQNSGWNFVYIFQLCYYIFHGTWGTILKLILVIHTDLFITIFMW